MDFCKNLERQINAEMVKLEQYKIDKIAQFNKFTNNFFSLPETETILHEFDTDYKSVTDRRLVPEKNPYVSTGPPVNRSIKRYAVEHKKLSRDVEVFIRDVIDVPLSRK
jgi:hypothetical protein